MSATFSFQPWRARVRHAPDRGAHGESAPGFAPGLVSGIAPNAEQGTLLAIGVEPDRMRICLLERVTGRYRLVGWLGAARQEHLALAGQAASLCRELGRRLHRVVWDDTARTPLVHSEHPLRLPPIEQVAVAATPLPCLRVGILGLTAGLSAQYALQAVHGGPAQVVTVHHFAPNHSAQALADALRGAQADALLLTGGYDAGPARPHMSLYAMLTLAARALQVLPPDQRPAVFFAGSKWAGLQAERILRGSGEVWPVILPNLMPDPAHVRDNVVAQALHALYARLVQRTPGYAELAAWANSGQAPTTLESNFARLVRAWRDYHNLSDLHGLYLSGSHRLHVWATAREEAVRLYYEPRLQEPEPEPEIAHADDQETAHANGTIQGRPLFDWPPVQLVCGSPEPGARLPHGVRWWDRGGLGPLLAALGSGAPLAVLQVLENDILVAPPNRESSGRAIPARGMRPTQVMGS